MVDDKRNPGPRDRDRINLGEDYEVRYWTQEFNCTDGQLRAAVKAVGVMVNDVRAYLANK